MVGGSLFREEALRGRRERLLGEVVVAQPVAWSLLGVLLVVAVAAGLLYLLGNDYTRREKVFGQLVPTQGLAAVFPTRPGLLVSLRVREGDQVAEGDALFELRVDQRTDAQGYLTDALIARLREQEQALVESLGLEQEALRTALALQDSRRARLERELVALEAQLRDQARLDALEAAAWARARELLAAGAIARADGEAVEKRFLASRQELERLRLSLEGRRFDLDEAGLGRRGLLVDSGKAVAALEQQLAELRGRLAAAAVERAVIVRAPVAGTVTSLRFKPGQQVDGVVPVLSLVPPAARLEAHLYVPTRAAGFVAERQAVNLRYDAFPYQRFGVQRGTVRQVSQAVLGARELPIALPSDEPVYRAVAVLQSQSISAYGREISLKPGMLLSADIELDRRSLFEWLLEPLYSLRGRL